MKNQDIPKLDTAKFLAGPVMNHLVVKQVIAAHAVFNTIIWEPSLLNSATSKVEKDAIVDSVAVELATSQGSGKILRPTQLSPETIPLHRRGLILQITGKIQNDSVYTPTKVISGVDLHNLDFDVFYSGFIEICQTLNITPEQLAVAVAPGRPDNRSISVSGIISDHPELGIPSPVSFENLKPHCKNMVINFFTNLTGDKGSLTFLDGIPLSYEGNNLMPLETGLPIVRPSPPGVMPFVDDTQGDPYASLANDQIKVINTSIKTLPTPKKAVAPKTGAPQRSGSRRGRGSSKST